MLVSFPVTNLQLQSLWECKNSKKIFHFTYTYLYMNTNIANGRSSKINDHLGKHNYRLESISYNDFEITWITHASVTSHIKLSSQRIPACRIMIALTAQPIKCAMTKVSVLCQIRSHLSSQSAAYTYKDNWHDACMPIEQKTAT